MFAQPYDHSFNDLFNQYVNMESSGPDGNKDSDFDQFFPLDPLSSDGGDHSPVSTSKPQQSPQPWTEEWSLQDDSAQFFQDSIHPSLVSDIAVNHFEVSSGPAEPAAITTTTTTSPSTPPATPRRKVTKSALVTPKSIRHRDPNERRSHLRKQSFSPSLMRSTIQKGRMAYPEAWAQRIQDFNLAGSDDRLPLSPPPTDVLIKHEHIPEAALSHHRDSADMAPHFFQPSPAVSMPSPSVGALARHQQQYMSHPGSAALTNSSPPSADDIFSSSHSSDPTSISSWQSDALGTSSLSFTPDLQQDQTWWSPMSSRVAQQQPSFQNIVPSPTTQRQMNGATCQNDMMQGGLMIQMDPSFDMSADSSYSNMLSQNHKFVTPTTAQVGPSRSPSLSPKAKAAKGAHRRTHSRKISGQSMTGPKSAKSTSPRGSNKSANVSFVNFTANDHQRILGGVAPSGSSKTKARREQEARDRRRKLSEAALIAVRNAGGDVEALEAVFC